MAQASRAMSDIVPDVTLDALFRRNTVLRADLPALRDAGGAVLTYRQVANAVGRVTEQIANFGLPRQSTIGILLPNGHELVVALLAVLRSGHIPVPMPVAWRKSDLVRACRESEVAALITTARFDFERLPELVAEVAIEVFELSFPCAFGEALPDGILPLAFDTQSDTPLANVPLANVSGSGIATLQPSSGGVAFILHSDEELLAAGLGAMLAGDIRSGDAIVSAVSFTSYAGLAAAFVPWLLSSGTLTLLSDVTGVAGAQSDRDLHLVASAGALSALASDDVSFLSAFAVHFGAPDGHISYAGLRAKNVVDVIALGEVAAIALPRSDPSMPAALPLGAIHAGKASAGSPVIAETRVEDGSLQIRGAVVAKDFLSGVDWVDTRYAAAVQDTKALSINPPHETIAIGALRFNLPDLERRIRNAAAGSSISLHEDALLGTRLVIGSERPEETAKALLAAGLPRIVVASVRQADQARAKAS